jgi:hypothetical protein
MLGWLFKKLKTFKNMNTGTPSSGNSEECLSRDLCQNISRIHEVLGQSSDLVIRRFIINLEHECAAAVVYIDGLADTFIWIMALIRKLPHEGSKCESFS